MDDDHALIAKWKDGDRAAGEALFERYFESIYAFFARKTSGDVSDLVQRTFLGLTEGRDRFQGDVPVRAYLYGIARNLLYGEYRQRSKDQNMSFSVTSLHDLEPTPSVQIAERQDSRLLLEALRRIPLDLQIAVELHYWEGLRGREMAVVLDIPEGTVRSRLRRALDALRTEVERLGQSDAALRSTLSDLDQWAAQLSERVGN